MLVSILDIVFHDDTSHHLKSYSICSNAVSKCQDKNFQFITYLDISGYRNSQLAWGKNHISLLSNLFGQLNSRNY